ncbi:MAG TPA: 5-bromo-4-chloroindolyl phosphate hydrolysis family protein [Clostridia bacterium]|nr:5-bromo-4-chloroindolyl phosphate hydrolysis family protein [Clostridia bacterium]
MGRRRWEHENGEFDDMRRNHGSGCHRGAGSLVGLIFGIISFSITLAFKIVEVVFQVLFGVLSGIGSSSKSADNVKNAPQKTAAEKQNVRYTVNDIKQEAAFTKKAEDTKVNKAADNVREFKKPENNNAQGAASAAEKGKHSNEGHNKDFYVVLFILTIIPAIVALAMGKLLYAGAIFAAGFGLMMVAGVISGISGSFKKRAAEQKVEEDKEESKDNESVEKLIKDAFEQLFEIRKDIDKIKDAEIRARTEAICCTGEKIIGEVRTNPESLTHVRKFFYYYLNAFGEIVKKYLRLSNFEESSEEVSKLVAETEKSFTDIDGIFKDLCEKLLEKDMMHLKAEINVIKNSN